MTLLFTSIYFQSCLSDPIGSCQCGDGHHGLTCVCAGLGEICGCHHRYGNVDVLYVFSGKPCCHSHHGTKHENSKFAASSHGAVIDRLTSSPYVKGAESVKLCSIFTPCRPPRARRSPLFPGKWRSSLRCRSISSPPAGQGRRSGPGCRRTPRCR